MSDARQVHISAPAKVNLGLEILSRRDDGYHELRSVLSMVDISDELTFTIEPNLTASKIDGVPGVTPADNLIMKAIDVFNQKAGTQSIVHVRAMKAIPAPAGLGGASSNAAAALVAMNHLHGNPLSPDELSDLAATLGSDVPFFLDSPTASVKGTGTVLTPLPNPAGWLIIVVPQIDLIAKTTKLYGMITPEDYTSGEHIQRVEDCLVANRELPPDDLVNAFERPLVTLMPYVRKVLRVMKEAGCPNVALTGAGPAHYALFSREEDAQAVKQQLQGLLGSHDYLIVTRFRSKPLAVDLG